MKRTLSLTLVLLFSSGCYHATIQTGLQPAGQTIERLWAHSFLWGLVPPSTIESMSTCPNGVARVDTKLSFLNQVASFITVGIYTPMTLTVSCAAAREQEQGQMGALPVIDNVEDATRAIRRGESFLVATR